MPRELAVAGVAGLDPPKPSPEEQKAQEISMDRTNVLDDDIVIQRSYVVFEVKHVTRGNAEFVESTYARV